MMIAMLVVIVFLLPPLASLLWLNPRIPLVTVSTLGRAVVVGASVVFAGQTVIVLFRCHLYPPFSLQIFYVLPPSLHQKYLNIFV